MRIEFLAWPERIKGVGDDELTGCGVRVWEVLGCHFAKRLIGEKGENK